MPKRLKAVTRDDALQASVSHMMNMLAASFVAPFTVVECTLQENHYCSWNRAIEIGWLVREYEDEKPLYAWQRPAMDAFCNQFLIGNFNSGPVVDLANYVFDACEEDLREWMDIVRESRVLESL